MADHKPRHKSDSRLRKPAAPQSNSRAWLLILGGLLLIGLTAAAIFLNQGPAAKVAASNPAAEISVAEAAEKYAAGVFLLDVRTPEEWTEVHIPNTTLIPLDELQARLSELPQNAEIVVVCRSGNRSQQGRDILREAGFEQVSSMAGGIREWSSQGHPTVSGS